MQGLKVMMALINNWDLKTDNNKVAKREKKTGQDSNLRIYYTSDLGGTFGTTGSFFRKLPFFKNAPAGTKGNPEGYATDKFISGVKNGEVVFNYSGKDPETLRGIKVENARWIGDWLAKLSDKQLSDAFTSAGYDLQNVAIYVKAVKDRIAELENLK